MKKNKILLFAIILLVAMVMAISVACTPNNDLPSDSGNASGNNSSSGNLSSGNASGDNKSITEKWEEKFAVDYRVDVFNQEEIDSLSREMELDLVYVMQYCEKNDDGRHPLGWISIFSNETDAEEYYNTQVEELHYDPNSGTIVVRDDKVVFLGTADGLKLYKEA